MAPTRSTLRDVRRRNRSALLTTLFFNAPLSRQELSHLTGLSVATVGNVTGELIEERLVVEAGLVDSDGGRPRVLLRVDPNYGHLVGIDVGETGVKAELFDLTMGRLAAVEHPMRSPRPDPAEVVVQVTAALDQVVDEAGVDQQSVIGVGVAVMTHGRIYQGATSSAGEWGHTTILYGGRQCRCGARGCLEAYVGAEAILDRYRRARRGRPVPGDDEESSLAALIEAAPSSRAAAKVLEETAGYLGAGIANLINLFNPERIVLGGWAGIALGEALLPRIRAAAEAHALRHPYGQTTIELCQLGPDAVAFGAATLPLAALLARGGLRGPAGGPGVPRSG